MCPGSITVKWRLLFWRTCSEWGDVYSQLWVCLSFRYSFMFPQGNQGFELSGFLTITILSILSWKRKLLFRRQEQVRSSHRHRSTILFFLFCWRRRGLCLHELTSFPHSLRYGLRLKATPVDVCISAPRLWSAALECKSVPTVTHQVCLLWKKRNLPVQHVRLQLAFKSHFTECLDSDSLLLNVQLTVQDFYVFLTFI